MIRNMHSEPGVVPGRYGGEAIPISDGPTPEQLAFQQHKCVADWLSWCCSMTPQVAREHVRVATALRRMPTIAGLNRSGFGGGIDPTKGWSHVSTAEVSG